MKLEGPPRYVIVHGHFYQPPRENPWIEAIEKQPSAHPYHDWNERVAWECYIPNKAARVVGQKDRILDMVNNYAWMSFNFGPTLLAWFELACPRDYQALLEADRESRARLGHGNAIAQAYNHMILPLATARDRATQILWGLADFRHRFGREPEAMWLPETGVNADTLRALIDHGLKYVLLAPGQAEKVRRLGRGGRWHDVSDGSINPRRAYRWFDKDPRGAPYHGRFLDVFFYDGELAKSVAFEHATRDSQAFADRIVAKFDPKSREPQLVHLATDGESYGHHEKYGEMGLAHLLKYELPKRGVHVVNYAAFLASHSPRAEVEIKPGLGTSWSCAHGVTRWMDDCGCGGGGAWHQRWRGPLRRALDWLRDELASLYEAEAGRLLRDPWAARDQYIEVLVDRGEASVGRFMSLHLKVLDTPENRQKALKLLEMQRHSMLTYTSCGWFFSELSGVEGVQNLKYAARALQLARELTGRDLEPEFLPRLKEAPSNLQEFGDGWGVYNKLVRPAIVTQDHIVGQYAISLLFGDLPEAHRVYHYALQRHAWTRNTVAGAKIVAGKATVLSGVTGEKWSRQFLAVSLQDQTVRAYVAEADGAFEDLRQRILGLTADDILKGVDQLRGPSFGDRAFTLESLFTDERERIFKLIIRNKLDRLETIYETLFQEYFPLVEELNRLRLPTPPLLRQEVELALGHWLANEVEAVAAARDADRLQQARAFVQRAKRAGLQIHAEEVEESWSKLVGAALDELERDPDADEAADLAQLVRFGLEAGFASWRYPTENRVFRLLDVVVRPRLGTGALSGEERALCDAMLEVADALGIAVDEHRKRLEAVLSAA